MGEIPSMWRTELWHPLSVHFPIGLLSLAALVGLAFLVFGRKNFAPYLRFSLSLLLWSGTLLFWVAFYTGDLAYSIVVRKICDPTVLKAHLYWAYVSGYIFSAAALLDVACLFIAATFRRWFVYLIILLVLGGTAAITYAGHLGAALVYQQGAATYQPSENCDEFAR